MKGSEVAKTADTLDNFVCNKNTFVEESAALNNSVAYSGDFAKVIDNLEVAFCKNGLNLKESFCMVNH